MDEPSTQQTRESLVYDLMEPFRFLIDLAVIRSFGTGRLDTSSFYFAEQDYSYHFELEAKGRFLDILSSRDPTVQRMANEIGRSRWRSTLAKYGKVVLSFYVLMSILVLFAAVAL